MKRARTRDQAPGHEVRIAASFAEALADMAAYYESLRPLFPDAGSRLQSFNRELFDRVIPALELNATEDPACTV